MKPTVAEELLKEIFRTNKVHDENGKEYQITSHIDEKEGEFIKDIITKYKLAKTIEIGCAYGISSLYICSSIQEFNNPKHTIIDPFQKASVNNIGITNLKRAGFDFFEHIEELSELALPELLSKGEKFDFGFIDGFHTFDHTLIDFFYLNRLIKVGGVIIIDDVGLPGINRLMRYILNYPSYELVGFVKKRKSKKREFYNLITNLPFRGFSKLFPIKLRNNYFSGKIVKSDKSLNINATMVAIRKTKEDKRNWDWFENF